MGSKRRLRTAVLIGLPVIAGLALVTAAFGQRWHRDWPPDLLQQRWRHYYAVPVLGLQVTATHHETWQPWGEPPESRDRQQKSCQSLFSGSGRAALIAM
jgi:hypothetical protein